VEQEYELHLGNSALLAEKNFKIKGELVSPSSNKHNIMRYKFCSLKSDEAIGICEANNETEATETFATIKKLPVSEFCKIYRTLKA
jgi:hypothetical protein